MQTKIIRYESQKNAIKIMCSRNVQDLSYPEYRAPFWYLFLSLFITGLYLYDLNDVGGVTYTILAGLFLFCMRNKLNKLCASFVLSSSYICVK